MSEVCPIGADRREILRMIVSRIEFLGIDRDEVRRTVLRYRSTGSRRGTT